jgi:hypothetical protein
MSQRRRCLALLGVAPLLAVIFAGVLIQANAGPEASGARTATPGASCTTYASSLEGAARAVAMARSGAMICLAAGSYPGKLSLTAKHTSDVVLGVSPGAHVSTGSISIAGSHIVVRDLWVHGEIALAAGTANVTIEHDDISNAAGVGGEGIVFDTSDCTAPNAPKWEGCEAQAPISNVTISANHIHDVGAGGSEDAIHLDNWRKVRITGNEFDHIVESGNHTDCVQSVYGGEGLLFDHNYEHDNDCQGFLVKDGDATNVSVTDNLFLRDQMGSYANFAQVWNTRGLTVEHNTIWDGKGLALVANEASFEPAATVDHNLIATFVIERPIGAPYALLEHDNVFGQSPWSFRASRSDRTVARPRFIQPTHGDFRLARNSRGIGVDWSPAGRRYGPAS